MALRLEEMPDPWEGTNYMTAEDYDLYCDARAEAESERRYERWLEDGGPHAEAIAAEDEIERRMEAMDVGLQMMRAEREAYEREVRDGQPVDAAT